jgi:hypothetical protein
LTKLDYGNAYAHEFTSVSASTTPVSDERCAARIIVGLSRSVTLAESAGLHQIQAGHHHLSLLARHGAALPHFTSMPDRGHSYETSTSIICYIDSLDARPSHLTTI